MEPKELPSFTVPLLLIGNLNSLATALKVQTPVQLYVVKTEQQINNSHPLDNTVKFRK